MDSTTGTLLKLACLCLGFSALAACHSTNSIADLDKPAAVDSIADLRDYGDELLHVALKQHLGSGFSAAIVDDDAVLWSLSLGTMTGTGAEALPLSADTPMHIGSVTKLFTALALMQLVEQGKVELDANLRTYLPEFSIKSRFGNGDFTLRQMLTHYSGLPSDLMQDFSAADPALTRALFDSTVERTALTHLKSRPDLAHSYSNLAFQLLGIVIQRVSGQNYDDYIREHIFAPLQMQHSSVLVPDDTGAWPLVQPTHDPRELGYEPIGALSAASIVSSLNDMALFMQMLLAEGERIVSKESFREMQRIQDDAATVGGGRQGLAFQLAYPPVTPQMSSGHSGALPGHYAYMRFFPEQQLGIIVLETNDDATNYTNLLGTRLRDVALEFVAAGSAKAPTADAPEPVEVEQSEAEAARYAGLYFAAGIGLLEVDNDESELTLRLVSTGLANAHLIATGADTFIPSLRLLGLIPVPSRIIGLQAPRLQFIFDGDKRYITLAANGAPPQALAASVSPQQISGAWLRRFGLYEPVDTSGGLLARVRLRRNQALGLPMVDARTAQGEKLELTLELLSDVQAAVAGVGRYTGEIIEFVSDEEFIFEGALFKKI
jgi:CubicO group peptidase (beta-lactamase class C family)